MCGWSLIREETRRSRKARRCSWCDELIELGIEYKATTGSMDGCIETTHMHPECYAGAQNWFLDTGEDCYTPGEFMRGQPLEKWYSPEVGT